MSDRGMKKWAPYRSLPEQNPHLINMKKNRQLKPKPIISNEEAEEINRILTNYHGEELIIRYYLKGEKYQIVNVILKIDLIERKIILKDKTSIPLKDIYFLETNN